MIRYADNATAQYVRDMWKTCFGDCDAYMDIYFREKYRNENTLIYFDNAQAVASLQMLPYQFTFYKEEITIAYFSGLCTLPEARKKGFMATLIQKAFEELTKQDISLAILVPQESWLLNFYRKFGFEQTFDPGRKLISLKQIIEKSANNLSEAYKLFDSEFRQKDMTVQKSFDDFCAIVQEANLFNYPTKENLIGMSRVINAQKLLSIFARKYKQKMFSLAIQDHMLKNNNALFEVENGEITKHESGAQADFCVNIGELAQLLMGYHTTEKGDPFRTLFPEKTSGINFMLE